jgi:hypothetical protein
MHPHTLLQFRFGFLGQAPVALGHRYLQVSSNEWHSQPVGAEVSLPSRISVDASGEVSCECKTSCCHATDLAELGAIACAPDQAMIALHVQRKQCAVMAAKVMVGAMTASAEQLATLQSTLQDLVSSVCVTPVRAACEIAPQPEVAEYVLDRIPTRKEAKATRSKRKHPIPTRPQILGEVASLTKSVRIKRS